MNESQSKRSSLLVVFIIAFFLSSWLVANVDIGDSVIWVSAFFIVILALPSYYYLTQWKGIQRSISIIIILAIIPVTVEAIGISTGFPYGAFYYTEQMGFKLFGLVPWSVMFAFGPLVIGGLAIAHRFTIDPKYVVPITALLLVIFDLVLDPAAVVLNIWVWVEPGPYYGIPLTNYSGWFITGLLTTLLLYVLLKGNLQSFINYPIELASSLTIILAFWTGYSLFTYLVIPAMIGVAMLALTTYFLILHPSQGGLSLE